MNKLAEAQKALLNCELSKEERAKKENEFLKKYYSLREKDERSVFGRLSLFQRQKLHRYILAIYKVKNLLCGFRCELIRDEREFTDRPIIFAVTHVGKFDIEVVSEAVKEHYYLLSGDYEHLQGTIENLFLNLNGVIYFNERVKEERKGVLERMVKHLSAGGNLMYFPEGTWNLTPNLPVLPCYWGIIETARQGNAVIIPVAAEQYGKRFVVNIGRNFDANQYGGSVEEKAKAITELRDILATLKWEIWESEPSQKRSQVDCKDWDEYVNERLKEWPYFNREYIAEMTYQPKGMTSSCIEG